MARRSGLPAARARRAGVSDAHYQRVTDAFQDLVDCSAEDRRELLEALGKQDPEVHRDVVSLLKFDEPKDPRGDVFSDDRISSSKDAFEKLLNEHLEGTTERSESEPVPEFVGPYTVLRRIGHGGMGTVYLCHQGAPLRRNVAVKVIRRGMDTREVVRRFDFEREAIARMNHPGIARVIDAGTTADGLPYIAMEHLDGVPLSDYCAGRCMQLESRLELFVSVLRALQHAHQRGVLHRDLKPSNVLVDTVNGQPVAKIIDFGLARALDTEPDEKATQMGQLLGTPAYMSPEQFDSDVAALDVRTDVYAAGVMLFELLTGELPFPVDPRAGFLQALQERASMTGPAPRPSRRYRDGEKDSVQRAAELGSPPGRLRRKLSGDLDWIVRTAMDPSPEQRYASVDLFADDIQAYLQRRPVSAGPPHWRYRSLRYLRRNRAVLGSAALVVVGLCGVLAILLHSNQRALAAESNAKSLLTDVESQNVVLNNMLQVADPRRVGPEARVTDMLEHGTEHVLKNYADRPRVMAGMMRSIGGIYRELEDWSEAERCLQLGLESQMRMDVQDPVMLAHHHNGLALLYTRMGRFTDAEEHYRSALDQTQGVTEPDTLGLVAGWEYNLGTMLLKVGRVVPAEEMLARSLESHRRYLPGNKVGIAVIQGRLGEIALAREDVDEGLALLRRSLDLALEIRDPGHPQICAAEMTLGRAFLRLGGHSEEARSQLRAALASARLGYGDSSPALITYLCPLASAERQCGDLDRADVLLLEAEKLLGPIENAATLPCTTVWRERAYWLIAADRPAEAIEPLERLRSIYAEIYEPGNLSQAEVESMLAEIRGDESANGPSD